MCVRGGILEDLDTAIEALVKVLFVKASET